MARVQLVMSEYLRHLAWRDADCACNTTSQHSLLLCSPRRTFVSIGCISVLPTWKSARNRVESSQLEPERRDRIQFISDSFQDKSTTDRHVPGRSFGKFRRWSTLCSLHRNRQIWSMRCSVRRRSGKPGQRRTGNSVWRGPWDVKDKNWNKHWIGQKRSDIKEAALVPCRSPLFSALQSPSWAVFFAQSWADLCWVPVCTLKPVAYQWARHCRLRPRRHGRWDRVWQTCWHDRVLCERR